PRPRRRLRVRDAMAARRAARPLVLGRSFVRPASLRQLHDLLRPRTRSALLTDAVVDRGPDRDARLALDDDALLRRDADRPQLVPTAPAPARGGARGLFRYALARDSRRDARSAPAGAARRDRRDPRRRGARGAARSADAAGRADARRSRVPRRRRDPPRVV